MTFRSSVKIEKWKIGVHIPFSVFTEKQN